MQSQTSGLATASFVCGILALVTCGMGGILGILAIVFGRIAMRDIDAGHRGGRDLAQKGKMFGKISLVLFAIWLLVGITLPMAIGNMR